MRIGTRGGSIQRHGIALQWQNMDVSTTRGNSSIEIQCGFSNYRWGKEMAHKQAT